MIVSNYDYSYLSMNGEQTRNILMGGLTFEALAMIRMTFFMNDPFVVRLFQEHVLGVGRDSRMFYFASIIYNSQKYSYAVCVGQCSLFWFFVLVLCFDSLF